MTEMYNRLKQLALPSPIAVVGMGVSGKAAFQVLRDAGYDVTAIDERQQDGVTQLSLDDGTALKSFSLLVVSPGVDSRKAAISQSGAEIINDVELFARLVDKPVVAVTGSNGKSTVVTMLYEALSASNLTVRLCGNIGRPVLDALFDDSDVADIYVLELSSYQLESCPSLKIDVGAVLNVSPDHLDRYDSYIDYVDAKANLARQSQVCILNAVDEACLEMSKYCPQPIFYAGDSQHFVKDGKIYIDGKAILEVNQLSVHGAHNFTNALATLLMIKALGINVEDAAKRLMLFRGLPHRMCLVSDKHGVKWLDDSKATNIGATATALAGATAPVWLIVGGVGKGQDFSELANVIKHSTVKEVLVIGIDNHAMLKEFDIAGVSYRICGEMHKAVEIARKEAISGDWVLLSPATASFDQFSSYAERGDCFSYEVTSLCHQ